jgi:hypothetical protein
VGGKIRVIVRHVGRLQYLKIPNYVGFFLSLPPLTETEDRAKIKEASLFCNWVFFMFFRTSTF